MFSPNSSLFDVNIPELDAGKKAYFASDFHLGSPNAEISRLREKKIVEWLGKVSADAQQIFLVGDLFDFWFEYKHVAPKGFVRLLGKLAEISDSGVELVIFCGNHDLWFRDYLKKELSAKIIYNPITVVLNSKKFYIAHGDGLGSGGLKFKLIKSIFTNPVCQWLFQWIHPNIGFGLANYWSSLSRNLEPSKSENLKLIEHSKQVEKTDHHDFYIYGDSHMAQTQKLSEEAKFVNLGDWISSFTYGEFDGKEMKLKNFEVS